MAVFDIKYSVKDADGDPSETTINVPDTFTIAQYGEFGIGMAEALDGLMSGRIDNAQLCLNVDLSALTGNTVAGTSDVEEIGSFNYLTSLGRDVIVNVPGLSETKVLAGSDDLDTSDADVIAMSTMMLDGITVTGGTIIPCDVGEDDIVTQISATEEFRASGRRR